MDNFEQYFSEPDRQVVILSPHFDDSALSVGGLMARLVRAGYQPITWIFFSRTNYVHHRPDSWLTKLPGYTAYISKLRLQEELRAQNTLDLTFKNIKLSNLNDAPLRQPKTILINPNDLHLSLNQNQMLLDSIRQLMRPLLQKSLDILAPLGIGGHIDHWLINQALLAEKINHHNPSARLFFYQDLPYAADLKNHCWLNCFFALSPIEADRYQSIKISINWPAKQLLLNNYSSQINKHWLQATARHSYADTSPGHPQASEKLYVLNQ